MWENWATCNGVFKCQRKMHTVETSEWPSKYNLGSCDNKITASTGKTGTVLKLNTITSYQPGDNYTIKSYSCWKLFCERRCFIQTSQTLNQDLFFQLKCHLQYLKLVFMLHFHPLNTSFSLFRNICRRMRPSCFNTEGGHGSWICRCDWRPLNAISASVINFCETLGE